MGKFGKGGKDVHGLGELARAAVGLGDTRGADEDGDAVGLLIVGVLGPDAMISEVEAMISPEHDDGVPGESETIQFIDHFADLGIDEAGACIVAVDELLGCCGSVGIDLTTALVGDLGRTCWMIFEGGHWKLLRIMHVPIFFGG